MFSWLKKRTSESEEKFVNVCSGVWDEDKAICNIYKDSDGDYWFLCRSEHYKDGNENSYEVSVDSLFERDYSVRNAFLNLEENKFAFRRSKLDSWGLVPRGDLAVFQKVEKYGWVVLNVLDNDHSFSYTIGLTENFNHPELLMFGLNSDARYEILNRRSNDIKNGCREVCYDKESNFDGFSLTDIPESTYIGLVGTAIRFYGGKPFLVKELHKTGGSHVDTLFKSKLLLR